MLDRNAVNISHPQFARWSTVYNQSLGGICQRPHRMFNTIKHLGR